MFLYLLKCSFCPRSKKYKTGITPDDLQVDRCLCGAKHNVSLITDNADNEIVEQVEEMEQSYFAGVM